MPFEREEIEALLEAIRSDPELRGRARRAILDGDLRAMNAALRTFDERLERASRFLEELAQTDAAIGRRLDRLAEGQERLTARVDDLAAQMAALTGRVDSLTEQMAALTQRVDQLTARVDQLTARMDQLTARVDALTARVDDLAAQMVVLTQRVDQLTARVDGLAAQMAALTQRVDQLTARVDQLTARLDDLAAQMAALTARVDALAEQMVTLTRRMDDMARRFDWMAGRLGNVEGWQFEGRYLQNLPSRLGLAYRNVRLLSLPDEDAVDRALRSGTLSKAQFEDVLALDAVARARPRDGDDEVVLAIEISLQVDRRDVERAARRAAILRRVFGSLVQAVAAGQSALPQAVEAAGEFGVLLLAAEGEAAA